jgi:N-acetylneuraminic acid mutarotase
MNADCVFNDLWEFDTRRNKWRIIETSGEEPTGRCAHACVSIENTLYVIGGMSPVGPTVFNTVYTIDLGNSKIDLESFEWSKNENDDAQRLDHSAVVIGDEIHVFGGMNFEHVFNNGFVLKPISIQ